MVDFNKKNRQRQQPAAPAARKSKFKAKGEQPPLRKCEEAGDSVIGWFQGYKISMLPDKSAPNGKKAVRFYEFRDEENEKERFVTSGRLMLDEAFDAVASLAGGADALLGELVEFRRLADTKLKEGKRMGNYEVEVYDTGDHKKED